ncbi:MAG TPA: alpha/beta hydrolase [Candidatus Angelobacter sp.]|jgi:acetyl esterase|nr:alpha/beta hydrolase [Candidatus Angelobacter sp.]
MSRKEPALNPEAPVLDPKTEWLLKLIRDQRGPDVFEMPLATVRKMQSTAQALFAGNKLPAEIESCAIPVGPKGKVELRIFRPAGNRSALPVAMFFHGGGWVLGDVETYDRLVRDIVNGIGATVVFVEMSLAPEERYPVPLEECYAATQWVADHAGDMRILPDQIAVAGDSSGGNIATAVTMLAKQRGGPSIKAQVLLYPATTNAFDTPSFQQFARSYYLTGDATRWFWQQYIPDHAMSAEATACPLKASIDQLKGLPPALVITAECDTLRDEGELYARKLMQAGVPVTCTRYLGAIHGFMGINALAETPVARAATTQMNNMLRQIFAAGTSEQKAVAI